MFTIEITGKISTIILLFERRISWDNFSHQALAIQLTKQCFPISSTLTQATTKIYSNKRYNMQQNTSKIQLEKELHCITILQPGIWPLEDLQSITVKCISSCPHVFSAFTWTLFYPTHPISSEQVFEQVFFCVFLVWSVCKRCVQQLGLYARAAYSKQTVILRWFCMFSGVL